jgi:hypothetical protein
MRPTPRILPIEANAKHCCLSFYVFQGEEFGDF